MRVKLAAIAALALLIPSAVNSSTQSTPIKSRVIRLEKRVTVLEQEVVALQALVCGQLPTC